MTTRQRGLATGLVIGLGIIGASSMLLHAERPFTSIPSPSPSPSMPAVSARHAVATTLGQLPLRFERNDGQFDPDTRFAARGLHYGVALRSTDAVIALRDSHGDAAAALRMSLVGAQPAAAVTGVDQQPGVINQLHGNDPAAWHSNIPSFARIRYAKVYDGIDLIYHGNEQRLEYDFEIAAGVDPRTIRMRFDGVTRVDVDDATGDLLLHIGDADPLRQHAPIAWQRIKGIDEPVESHYAIQADGTVGFDVGAYDHGAPLTIDPVILYSSLFGGQSEEDLYDLALDPAGNIYITGRTQDAVGFPTTPGAISTTRGGPSDAFVSKFNPAGTALIYSTYLGGSSDEDFRGQFAGRIAVDAAGNAYVAGDTNSADFPITAGAFDNSYADNVAHPSDVFYAKLSPTGGLLYSTFIGGANYEYTTGIAVDSTGNVYVAGVTNSDNTTFPMSANAYRANTTGSYDMFLFKFDAAGARLYSTYFGSTNQENDALESGGLAIDDTGHAYIAFTTQVNTGLTIVNGFQGTLGGNHDAFLAKFDTTQAGVASLVYSTFLGGANNEYAFGLAYAGNGQVVMVGEAATGFTTKNALDASFNGGGFDGFIAKIDTTQTGANSLVFATYLGGSANENIYDVAVDPSGTIHIVGGTQSWDPLESTCRHASLSIL